MITQRLQSPKKKKEEKSRLRLVGSAPILGGQKRRHLFLFISNLTAWRLYLLAHRTLCFCERKYPGNPMRHSQQQKQQQKQQPVEHQCNVHIKKDTYLLFICFADKKFALSTEQIGLRGCIVSTFK